MSSSSRLSISSLVNPSGHHHHYHSPHSPLSISSLISPTSSTPAPLSMLSLVHAVQHHFPDVVPISPTSISTTTSSSSSSTSSTSSSTCPSPSPAAPAQQTRRKAPQRQSQRQNQTSRVQTKKARRATAATITKASSANNKKICCPSCPEAFEPNAIPIKYCLAHRTDPNRPYICPSCDLSFTTVRDLVRHAQRHEATVLVWECSCMLTFTRDYNMRRHQRHVNNAGCRMKGKIWTEQHGGRRAPVTKRGGMRVNLRELCGGI